MERTVVRKGTTELPSRPDHLQYSVAWNSTEYGMGGTGKAALSDDPWVRDCYERAEVGQPPPDACLTRDVLFMETGSLTSRPWISFGLIVAVLAAVGYIAMRHVAQVPRLARAEALAPRARRPAVAYEGAGGTPASAILRADRDREAFRDANAALSKMAEPGYGRRLFWRGTLGGLAWVLALGFLVSFVAAGEWALLASGLLVLCVIAAYLAAIVLTDNLTNVAHVRSLFALGVALGFIVGAFVGSLILDPLLEWDGMRWLL